MKAYVYFIGKTRDPHLNGAADEYFKRAQRYLKCEVREIHPERFDVWARHPTATKILLDPEGRPMDSQQFAKLIGSAEEEARDLVFVIGGHDGLPPAWKKRADRLLSLSAMTWPHELARVMLAEQIYRGLTILRGHPYPR